MSRSVFYISDQFFILSGSSSQFLIHLTTQFFYQCNVCPFIMTPNIVSFPNSSLVKNNINCPCMVFYKQPISNILAFPVNRKRLFVDNIMNTKRNQFFREMIRTIIVGAIGNFNWQSKSVIVGSYKMI